MSSQWQRRLSTSLLLTEAQPESRFFQLATLSTDGRIENRTVVYRGFDHDINAMWIITDRRSQKFQDIKHNANASACWYFAKTREQYRFQVSCSARTVMDNEAQCHDCWRGLSYSAKIQFLWGEPGQARDKPEQPLTSLQPVTDNPPANFCMVYLHIREVDYLNLKGNPQIREQYQYCEGKWQHRAVIP